MRRAMILAAIGVAALLVAACTPEVTVENPPAPVDGGPTGISVSATGEVTGTPDTLTMSFGVRVVDVRTSIVRGKVKRVRRSFGKKPNWKKAIVTLHDEDTIELFEGV